MSTIAPAVPATAEFWSAHETHSRARIEEMQLGALRRQLLYVAEHSDFYRRRFAEIDWHPSSLRDFEDLRAMPFTTKQDYLAALKEQPPLGSALAASPGDVRRIHFSSGTTGSPAPMPWTQVDLDRWADLYARGAYSQGVRPGDVYQCLFSFSWFVGGLGAVAGYQRLGATTIPGGATDTQRQLDTMLQYGTTALGGTPSFLLHLAEAAEERGIDLTAGPVRVIMTGGEPGGALAGVRRNLEERWGAKVYDGYGSIEFQPTAWECHVQAGGHLAEDFAYAEILHPDTYEPVPDGTPGVLVLTHLDKQATPLVRWWTGDVVIRDRTQCACGRTSARLPGGVVGRADDMLIVRGVNLFPSGVEDVVRRTLGANEFRIVLDHSVVDPATGFLTGIRLEVEAERASTGTVEDRLIAAIKQELQVRAVVTTVAPGSLERTGHKSQRVVNRL